jgi:CspA family cold shock protein
VETADVPLSGSTRDHEAIAGNLDIRRPELLGVRRRGTVRWFKEEKGYGRITAEDGEVLFLSFADIEIKGYRTLDPGQHVTFVWNGWTGDHGRHRADSVRPEPP